MSLTNPKQNKGDLGAVADTSKTRPVADAEHKAHWQSLGLRDGTDLQATTMTATIKRLEVDALRRTIDQALVNKTSAHILEAGCGNGQNLVPLASMFPRCTFQGFDIVPEMVEAARKNVAEAGF